MRGERHQRLKSDKNTNSWDRYLALPIKCIIKRHSYNDYFLIFSLNQIYVALSTPHWTIFPTQSSIDISKIKTSLLERRTLQCSNNSCERTWYPGKMHSSVEVAVLLEEGRIISKESVYSNACIKDHSVLSSAVHWIFSSKPRICCLQV